MARKNSTKRSSIISFLLVMILLVTSVMTGCGKSEGNTGNTSPKTSQDASKTVSGQAAGTAAEVKQEDWFKFQEYVLPKALTDNYSKKLVDTYKNVIDAYVNYKTSVKCDPKFVDVIFYNIQLVFPPFDSDTKYHVFENYNKKKKTMKWKYTDTKEEHDQKLAAFQSNVEKWINECTQKDDPDIVKAIAVYQNFSSQVNYDFKAINKSGNVENGKDISAFRALNDKKGICTSFASGYAYLLLQLGIDSGTMGGFAKKDGKIEGHEWTVFNYDGQTYAADPTMERHHSKGKGLLYFGTNNKERAKQGFKKSTLTIDLMGVPKNYYKVTGTKFNEFRGMKKVTIDRENKCYHCKDKKGNEKDLAW